MGLWDALTRQRHFGTTVFSWKEPWLYRARLRGDVWLRLAIIAGLWTAAAGIFLVLFAMNVRPPGMLLAIGLGAVFGLGPGILFLLMRRSLAGGSIQINAEGISRYRTYASLDFSGWSEWTEWPFDAIDRCVIVPAQHLGRSFSVLQLQADGDWELIGIPGWMDVKSLARHLAEQGVSVVPAKEVKREFTTGMGLAPAVAVLPAALAMLIGGLTFYLIKTGGRGPQRPGVPAIARAERAAPDHWRPAVDGGNPTAPPWNDGSPTEQQPSPPPSGFGAPLRPPAAPTGRMPTGFGAPVAPGASPGTVGRPTELLGGAGGSPFSRTSPNGQPVVGVRYRLGTWGGRERVGMLEPLFAANALPGDVILARDGYALGALQVDAGEYVDAVALVFMRLTPDGRLDPGDRYTSEWIGTPTGGDPRMLGDGSAKVIGIAGRGAAVLDAVGLVLE